MAINSYTEDEFVKILNRHLSSAKPISSLECLFGREKEMGLIREALFSEGCHVFIYGDRGVGKSSLAASAAAQYQSSDNAPLQVPCGPDTEFYKTIEEITERVIKKASGTRKYATEHSVDVKVYKLTVKEREIEIIIPKVDSMYSAVEAIEDVAKYHSKSPVIVIDEFDQITSDKERRLFATFLKDIGDRGVNIKFIFTGVASSLYKLLGDHKSSFRQLYTIELGRLYWTPREDIVNTAVNAYDLEIDPEVTHLIAKISNGFPYYVHLITQCLLWVVFHKEEMVTRVDRGHFDEALRNAIIGSSAHLHEPYTLATLHRSCDYRDIVWATADSESVIRYTDKMFQSYLRIHKQVYGSSPSLDQRPLPKNKFATKLNSLKKPTHGQIIENVDGRRGLYSYKENILRGYVAMKALEAGVELHGDEPDEPKVPTALAKERHHRAAHKDWTPKVKYRGEP